MSPTDDGVSGDGGFALEAAESQVEVSRRDQLREVWQTHVYEPGVVAWDDRRTRVGAVILLAYVLVSTVGVALYPAPSKNQVPAGRQPFETTAAPLGSTPAGTDVLAQTVHATPDVLLMVTSGAVFATAMAVFVGTVAGYKGGLTDRVITTVSDVAMAIPGLPIVMVVAFIYQPTNPLVIGPLIVVNYWAGLGRAIRSQVLTLREESYVEASRAMGVSTARILRTDVLPNLMPFVLVNFAFAARYVVFASVGLYYLGVLPAGLDNWGLQLDRAYNTYSALVGSGALYLIVVPMIAIAVLALALVLLAQGLDRVYNPRVRTRLAGESATTGATGESDGAGSEDDEPVATGGI